MPKVSDNKGVFTTAASLGMLTADQGYDSPANWNQRQAKVLANIQAWNSN